MPSNRQTNLDVKAAAGVVVAVVFLALSMLLIFWDWVPGWSEKLTIAAGFEDGVYHHLGEGLVAVVNKYKGRDVAVRLASNGSYENMQLIAEGKADIGFVQSDTQGDDNVRAIATLYDELLHIIVRSTDASMLGYSALEGKTVAIGPKGSGTFQVAQRLMEHYGVKIHVSHIPVARLEAAFAQAEIDAAILLTAINSPITKQLLSSGQFTLLSLDRNDSDGDETLALSQIFPHYSPAKIYPRVYGKYPKDTIHTISVKATLVARADLSASVVRDITELLYASRSELSKKHGAVEQLREQWNATEVQYPFHQGAIDYYNRSKPLFVVEYSEALSLALSVLMLMFAGFTGFSAWLDKRAKNYIDRFYQKVHNIDIEDEKSLRQLDRALDEAVRDLIDEKLEANASFQILQSLVLQRMIKILLLRLDETTSK